MPYKRIGRAWLRNCTRIVRCASRACCTLSGMAESLTANRVVLLIGRTLYIAAVEASLRAEPGIHVQRLDGWSPVQLNGAWRPDAVIVDSITAHAELVATLVAAHPELLVIELAWGEQSSSQAIVRFGGRRTLGNAHDLVRLIVDGGSGW